MSSREIRANLALKFDEEKERDTILFLEQLSSQKKLSEFVGTLIRVAMDYSFKDMNNEQFVNTLKETVDNRCTPVRKAFFNDIHKEVSSNTQKISDVYTMAFEMYTANKLGRVIGIDKRAEDMLAATFMIERQTRALETIVGSYKTVYESDKWLRTEEKAEEVIECVINKYGAILEELKSMTAVPMTAAIQQVATQQVATQQVATQQVATQQVVPAVVEEKITTEKNVEQAEVSESRADEVINVESGAVESKQKLVVPDITDEEDIVIDFGDADLDALEDFFG